MQSDKEVSLDVSKIRMAIRAGIPLSITTYTLPREMSVYMEEVLTAFLTELNQTQMIEYLKYCLGELVSNAKKANTKRLYFKEKGLDIYYINDAPHLKKDGINYIVAPTVEEFVGYIKNASCVVTNSFHGTAFSIIFRKNLFVEFKNKSGRNIRSESLLKTLGINREIINGNSEETPIHWEEVSDRLSCEIEKSLNYLKSILD